MLTPKVTKMTPEVDMITRLFQGRREAIRPSACLFCRTTAHVRDEGKARQLFLETGICGACHTAIDNWCALTQRAGQAA